MGWRRPLRSEVADVIRRFRATQTAVMLGILTFAGPPRRRVSRGWSTMCGRTCCHDEVGARYGTGGIEAIGATMRPIAKVTMPAKNSTCCGAHTHKSLTRTVYQRSCPGDPIARLSTPRRFP